MPIKPSDFAAPAIRIAAAGLGAVLGGPLGLALGAGLGAAFGDALGDAGGKLVELYAKKFADEAAKKFGVLGGDSLAERLKPTAPALADLQRKALLLSLDRMSGKAPSGYGSWFRNWHKALASSAPLQLDAFSPGQLVPSDLDALLPRALSLVDAQGSAKPVPRSIEPSLMAYIVAHLPIEFPRDFSALIVKKEYSEAWNEAQLGFQAATTALLSSIDKRTANIDETTTATASKVDEIHARLVGPAAAQASKRQPQNLPFASLGDLFKGREEDLKSLEEQLERHGATAIVQPASITGMGGIGKTRLAIEYALRNHEKFSALLFAAANTPQELESNIAALSSPQTLDLPAYRTGNQPGQYAAVVQWLQADKDWLLILDNVDTAGAVKAVRELVSKFTGGHTLITSRIAAWGGSIHAMGLHQLSDKAAVSYLLERTTGSRRTLASDEADAGLVAADLGCLALALEQAAAYIQARTISFAEYRTRWRANNAGLIDFYDELIMEYSRSVFVTLKTTIDRLSADGLKLLHILAWLAPDPIPQSLLSGRGGPFAAETEDGLPEGEWPGAVERAEAALAELERFSLANPSENKDSFSVHRVTQAVARRTQSGDAQQQFAATALRWVNAGFPFECDDVRFWPVAEALAPHARGLAEEADRRSIPEPTSRLMNELGVFYQSRAEWVQAEPLKRRALEIDEWSYGSDHPRVAIDLNNLAHLLQATNRLAEAEPLMRRALRIDEKSYGSDHPRVATDLNNLAQLLQDTNRLAEAEPLLRRVVAIFEKNDPEKQPNYAGALNNLAALLQATNRLAEAEPLMRRALQIDENSYGSEHPKVAIRLNNLSQLLHATNRLPAAEPLMRRALQIDEKSYGSDHPDVAIDLNNLAQLLQATNRLAEAEPLMRRALLIDEKSYGSDHPRVAIRLNNLARLLQATNRLAEAEPLMRRALGIDEKSYGSDHPDVAIDLNNLAQLLKATNRLAEAEPLMRRALGIDENSYGSDHPDVAIDLNNLAQLLNATNRLAEAEPLMRSHLEIFLKFSRSTGHPHPNLQAAVNNYGGLLEERGYTSEQVLARLREMAPEFFP